MNQPALRGSDGCKRLGRNAREGAGVEDGPGRSSTLKLRNGETDESVLTFGEVAPVGTVTPMHLHHDSDEVA
jgi:hypothetical protein